MKEYELEILDQYELGIKGTRKVRGAFFCDTKEGTMLLKETKVSDRRALLMYQILKELEKTKKIKSDLPIYNKEGKLITVSRYGKNYMMKNWFIGKECDVTDETEILCAVSELAKLHRGWTFREPQYLEQSNDQGTVLKPLVGRALQEEFVRHNREMRKVRNYIRKRVSKGSFEFLYLENFERMFCLAEKITDNLRSFGCNELYEKSVEQKTLIHGDYNYHNILFTATGAVITNFEHVRIDVQVHDLYYFMRKVLEKNEWNYKLGKAMLQTYDGERKLQKNELEYLALCLAYPEKFWKMASTYYHSNKAWIPEKNVEKLEVAIKQTDERIKFLKEIFAFHL